MLVTIIEFIKNVTNFLGKEGVRVDTKNRIN